jgi:hypothetical protein
MKCVSRLFHVGFGQHYAGVVTVIVQPRIARLTTVYYVVLLFLQTVKFHAGVSVSWRQMRFQYIFVGCG